MPIRPLNPNRLDVNQRGQKNKVTLESWRNWMTSEKPNTGFSRYDEAGGGNRSTFGGIGQTGTAGHPGGGGCNNLYFVYKEVSLSFMSIPSTESRDVAEGTWTLYVKCTNKYWGGFGMGGLSQSGADEACKDLARRIRLYCAEKASPEGCTRNCNWVVGDLYCGQEDKICTGEPVSQGGDWDGGAGGTTGESVNTGGVIRACSLQDAFDKMFPGQNAYDGKGCTYGWIRLEGYLYPPTRADAEAACTCNIDELS